MSMSSWAISGDKKNILSVDIAKKILKYVDLFNIPSNEIDIVPCKNNDGALIVIIAELGQSDANTYGEKIIKGLNKKFPMIFSLSKPLTSNVQVLNRYECVKPDTFSIYITVNRNNDLARLHIKRT